MAFHSMFHPCLKRTKLRDWGKLLCYLFFVAFGALASDRSAAQTLSEPPLLPLDEAIRLAIANNRTLRIALLEVQKSNWQVSEIKTKRLPSLSTNVLAAQLLTEVNFTFPEGAFGTFPATGPIPAADTQISTPRRPAVYATGQIAQPLSQLYKIHLGVRAQQLSSQVASESERQQRQTVIRDVKQAYYAVLQTESALEAAEASLKQYQELDRVVLQRVAQEAALKSDSLDVKARLAQEQYEILQLQNSLQSRKENLNNLLGRDIRVEFRTQQVPPASFVEADLRISREEALRQRPEIKQAELLVREAEYDRRLASADYIPDVSLAFNYISPFNVEVLPRNIAALGLQLKWEPWDWGRRKDVVNQKKKVEDQAQEKLRETQAKVLMDVSDRFRKLEEARMLLRVAEASREASRQRLQEVTYKYEQQAVLFRDVLQQQAAVAGADDSYQEAVLGVWNAKAEFEKAMGEE